MNTTSKVKVIVAIATVALLMLVPIYNGKKNIALLEMKNDHEREEMNDKILTLAKANEALAARNEKLAEKFDLFTKELDEQFKKMKDKDGNLSEESAVLWEEIHKVRLELDGYKERYVDLYDKAGYLAYLKVEGKMADTGSGFRSSLSGSVIKYDEKLFILTAAHLHDAKREITKITAEFGFGKSSQETEIVGYDHNYDLMLLTFKDPNFKYEGPILELADKKEPLIGDEVIALGCPMGYSYVLTDGAVSKMKTDSPSPRILIMHTAKINPGNSGGPLLNMEGKLVGVNVQVQYDPFNKAVSQMYFAVSVFSVHQIISELANGSKN